MMASLVINQRLLSSFLEILKKSYKHLIKKIKHLLIEFNNKTYKGLTITAKNVYIVSEYAL